METFQFIQKRNLSEAGQRQKQEEHEPVLSGSRRFELRLNASPVWPWVSHLPSFDPSFSISPLLNHVPLQESFPLASGVDLLGLPALCRLVWLGLSLQVLTLLSMEPRDCWELPSPSMSYPGPRETWGGEPLPHILNQSLGHPSPTTDGDNGPDH